MVESEGESEISMTETRRRIHNLLDDTFTTLKKYQKQLLRDEPISPVKTHNNNKENMSSPARKYAGMAPALPDPVPAHGRASTLPPGGLKQRIIQNPYVNPYNSLFNDPMIAWDPMERQRYDFHCTKRESYRCTDEDEQFCSLWETTFFSLLIFIAYQLFYLLKCFDFLA